MSDIWRHKTEDSCWGSRKKGMRNTRMEGGVAIKSEKAEKARRWTRKSAVPCLI